MSASTKLDYSKFEALAREVEQTEQNQKELDRARNKLRYEKEQKERQKKWIEEKKKEREKAKAAGQTILNDHENGGEGHGHSHNGGHGHSHADGTDHNHSHGDGTDHHHSHSSDGSQHSHSHSNDGTATATATATAKPVIAAPAKTAAEEEEEELQKWAPRSNCGCGYVDPEQLKKMQEERQNKPEMPLEIRNAKKMAAVKATREDGNRFFKEKDFETALQIYERGILIANGAYGLSDADQSELSGLEVTLELNAAACKLKLKRYLEAINSCKIVLNIDKTNVKAMYRIAEAMMGMGEYNAAIKQFNQTMQSAKTQPEKKSCQKMIEECQKLESDATAKQKAFEKEMARKLRMNAEQTSNNTGTTANTTTTTAAAAVATAPAVAAAAAVAATPAK